MKIVVGVSFLLIVIWILRNMIKKIYWMNMTPTMKFILAANATTDLHTFKTCIDVNGYRYHIFGHLFAKFILNGGWGVNDKESAVDMIKWLLDEGHNKDFMEDLKWVNDGGFPKEIEYAESEEDEEEENNELRQMKKHFRNLKKAQENYPSQGILAWDLCRVLYIAGGAYLSGYFTYKEALGYCVQACRLLQENYSSWDHMMGSYLIGYNDWCESINNDSRLKKYEKLKKIPNGLYSIPWYTPLDEDDVIHQRVL